MLKNLKLLHYLPIISDKNNKNALLKNCFPDLHHFIRYNEIFERGGCNIGKTQKSIVWQK